MRSLILIFCIFTLFSGCAIRKDLETPAATPNNKPALNDGGGTDASQGTKYCKPDANNQFDAITIVMDSGQTPADGSAWAEGGGCILKSIRETWATFNNLEVMKFHAADSFTYTRTIQPKPDITHLYEITYNKGTIIGPIDWTIDWFHGFDKGTFEAPERVNINYQRIRGTSNIPIWHGGIVLTKVNNEVTSVAIRNEFKARQSSSDNEASARSALNEMIVSSRSGTPDWSRLNTGLKENPDQPDSPPTAGGGTVVSTPYCTKDKDGHYPTQPEVIATTDTGVSTLKIRTCITRDAGNIYNLMKNPAALRWKNTSSAVANSANSVSYEKTKIFSHIKWNMTWQYDDSKLSVAYKIDPATPEFPVWSGHLNIVSLEAGISEIDFENDLLTDVVSQSTDQNKTILLGLLADIAANLH